MHARRKNCLKKNQSHCSHAVICTCVSKLSKKHHKSVQLTKCWNCTTNKKPGQTDCKKRTKKLLAKTNSVTLFLVNRTSVKKLSKPPHKNLESKKRSILNNQQQTRSKVTARNARKKKNCLKKNQSHCSHAVIRTCVSKLSKKTSSIQKSPASLQSGSSYQETHINKNLHFENAFNL